jgi:hypothetical protein
LDRSTADDPGRGVTRARRNDPVWVAEQHEARALLNKAVAALDEPDRKLVTCLQDEMTDQQIRDALGLSRWFLDRAMNRIKQKLGPALRAFPE